MPNVHGSKWIAKSTRLAIYLRDQFTCVYCGKDLHGAHVRGVTLDHLIPRERGGSNCPTNLVTACKTCNDSKGDTPWRRWVKRYLLKRCPQCNSQRTVPTAGNAVGSDMDCLHCGTDFRSDTVVQQVIARVTRQRRRKLSVYRPLARAIIAGSEDQPYVTRSLYIPVPKAQYPAPPDLTIEHPFWE